MKTILYFLVVAGLIFLVSNLGSSIGYNGHFINIGISLNNGFTSALIFSLALTVVNTVLGGILRLVGFPINFMTFGLFSIVVTFLMIYITQRIYAGIDVQGIPAYVIIAIIPAVVGFFIKPFFK